MSNQPNTLSARHADLTQRLILDAAIELIQMASVSQLSVRAVARHANISERTIFRYFASREDLLDAIAAEVSRRLDAPPDPTTVEELLAYPKAIYARFEASAALTEAVLHSELYHRIRTTDASKRMKAIRAVVDAAAPGRPERHRRLATADIHYHVVASTWRYFRSYFGLSPQDATECARMAIEQSLAALGVDLPIGARKRAAPSSKPNP